MTYIPNQINTVLTDNSTATPLLLGVTWNGVWTDVSEWGSILVSSFSDQDGTMIIEFSTDNGANIDSALSWSATGGINEVHRLTISKQYARVSYTNGGVNQTAFRLQTLVGDLQPLTFNVGANLPSDWDALVTKSVAVGESPEGTYNNIPAYGDVFREETPLGIGGTFTSPIFDASKYQQVITTLFADEDGTATFEFADDPTMAVLTRTLTIPYSATDGFQVLSSIVFSPYIRYKYTNGGVAQTQFSYATRVGTTGITGQILDLNSFVSPTMIANLGRNVIVGQTPNGAFENVPVTPTNELKVSIENPTTAFGDLRTAELTPQFQGSFEYTVDNTDINTNTVVGSGTVTQGDAMAQVATGTTTGSSALFQSAFTARYRAGFGASCRFTARFTGGSADTYQWIGIMDEQGSSSAFKNGFAIGYEQGALSAVRFKNDATNVITQGAGWDDPLDGSGRSGMTWIPGNLNVFQIRFQYLGAGAIVYEIEDPLTGRFVEFLRIPYTNANTTPHVYNPNFRFTIWADNDTTILDKTVYCSSYAYFIEGKTKFFEVHQPQQSSGSVEKTTVTTEVALFTIRNKATYAGKTNFIDAVMELASSSIEAGATNNLGAVRIVKNATIGGAPSWSDINATNSIMEIDVAGTTVTGGTELLNVPLAGKNDKGVIDVTDFDIILHPNETITLAGLSANSATINGFLLWKELF